jgi:glutaredoxin
MKTKGKLGMHHRVHRHIKKHMARLKRKRPHAHKMVVLMSIALPLVLGTLLFGSSALYMFESYQEDLLGLGKEKITVNLPVVQDDTLAWKTYQDKMTGFSVKYPDHWPNPGVEEGNSSSKYLKKVSFSNGLNATDKNLKGYNIYIYSGTKISGPAGTDNLSPQNSATYKANNCDKSEFQQATLGEGGYPAQEVDIKNNDRCFTEAYFYSVARGKYIYNIVPVVGETDSPIDIGEKGDVIAGFPKFFEILSTLVLPQEEQKAQVEKDIIQKNIVQKKAAPRRVLISKARCPHKNDHPRKSKTKGPHMDEDCCMDPDEWPNPRCQY